MLDSSIKIKGFNKLARQLIKMGKDAGPAMASALYKEGEQIMAEAKELTPVDTGALRASGFVSLPSEDGFYTNSIILSFGGPAGSENVGESNEEDVGYAIIVHEDMQATHKVGQAKYLETPFKKATDGLGSRLALRMKGKL